MKLFKRFGAALLSVLILSAALTGPVLAAEPAQSDGITVQLDGKNLAFTDAAPEITNDRTFLPFRAVLEAMGAEVGYDAGTSTVSAQKGDIKIAMVPGQTALTVTEGGQTRTETMDVAPYIKASNSQTYIPVRYAAEAFGYNVGWDQGNRTVILVDVDALFGDATFQLMDNLAAYSNKQDAVENMSLAGNLTMNVTDKTSMELTKPISFKGSLDGVIGEKGVQLTGKVDGATIAAMFGTVVGGGADVGAIFQELMGATMPDVSAELRADLDTKMLYCCLPALLTGEPADAWYSLDLSALQDQLPSWITDMDQLTQLQAQLQDAGIREALVAVLQSLPVYNSTSSYEVVSLLANTYKSTLSDQVFTQNGNTYVAQTTLENIMNMTVTLTQEGDDIVAADIKMSCEVDESGSKMIMTMDMHAASDKVDMVMKLSQEDEGLLVALQLDLGCVPTDTAPVTTLPAGVQVTPLGSYGDGGASPAEG